MKRAKILSGSNIIPAGGNRLTLLNVLQKAVLSLSNQSDPSSLMFVDALLQFYLLHVVSSSSSGSAIRGSGMVPTLLPFLQDVNSAHMHLVCSAVKTLQKLMDYSSQAVNSFKESGGMELLAKRLQSEIQGVIEAPDDRSISMVVGDSLNLADDHLYSRKCLIKALLKALGSATYAPTNPTRSQNSLDTPILSSLSLIFRNVSKFGGDIYFSAVTVMNEIIHKDPTCFPALHEAGLPDDFLSSVISGMLPSSKALTCIPSGLGAICLNAKGLEAVRESDALHFLYHIFTSRKYLVAMNEAVVPLANAVEELLRHVTSLKSAGVNIIIEIINKLVSLGDDVDVGPTPSGKSDASSSMETDSEDKGIEGSDRLVSASDSIADSIGNERFVQLCIFHLMVLLHRTMENTETCKLFVEKKGIEALLRLLLRPSISQSSEGMSIALHSTAVFKGFTQNHAAPLAHAFCSSLRDHLKKSLKELSSLPGSFFLVSGSTPDSGIFSSLCVIEFLLFLAASKDNRWMAALLTEFGNKSKDVLEDIGQIHKETLWQIALLEDSRSEEDQSHASIGEPVRVDSSLNETEEHRFSSFRPLTDLRRRTPGWSIESQFFDLINLSRDARRASGLQQRLGIDGPSNLQLSSQLHLSNPSSSSDASTSTDGDKQRSHASSWRDMMRSISFHINHLFLELGKVTLIPSRRGGEPSNVTSSAKSVVSTITSVALDHLNFVGHVDPLKTEASMSTKCRYLGKVIDFIDCIIAEKPESCNPILLNCFYVHGVIQAILTTFEATSQLLFALNRSPASPMDMDDATLKDDLKEETDYGWIYGPLVSYSTLMDRLVTSSFIISSSSSNLLVQPIMSGRSVPVPRNPEAFVKLLQSKVLKAVLPIWSHPQFAGCNSEFITTVISIMRHIYSGVEDTKASASAAARNMGPPLDEASISAVIEMGFSRSRAEEAFRQVGTNIVEMALDWLCTHPEEPEEEDDLARAVAMSLGDAPKEDEVASGSDLDLEKETVEPPPVDELLSACSRLLRAKDSLAFPVQGLLAMICAQNDGRCRSTVVTFIIDQLKVCSTVSDSRSDSLLSALFHVLALVLHEDAAAREVASTSGLVRIALDFLLVWNPELHGGDKSHTPKWVTASFLAIDRMLLVDPNLGLNIKSLEVLKGEDVGNQISVVTNDLQSPVKSRIGSMEVHEERRLIDIACRCIRDQLPSEAMHAVLQLCATLTKVHSAALSFLDAGGLPALLSLPTSSLFSGFDNVAATIIRHILEDPYTLQQAMEAEIRYSLVAAANRHSNGRLTPHNFLQSLASVISRDPAIFLQAAQSICQIEMVGERPYVVLLKDREKDKSKEKEKEKSSEKDKQPFSAGKTNSLDTISAVPAIGHNKPPESNIKNVKAHRKPPPSFTCVIELLLDSIITFEPPSNNNEEIEGILSTPSLADMDIDDTASRGKGKAIVCTSEERKAADQEASAVLAKTVFIMKLLTDILLTYASSLHVLLRKDAEVSNSRGHPQRFPGGNFIGGIFNHVLHKFLPYSSSYKKEKKTDGDWRQKLASRAGQFLVAASVRSSEARKRIFSEINNVFNDFVESSDGVRIPDFVTNAFIDLLNDILAARSPTGSYILAEASTTFIDVGLVQSLTRTLKVLDLDHPDSPKTATAIIKALDSVTKEYVHSADPNSVKADSSTKPATDQNQPTSGVNGLQSLDATSQPDHHDTADDRSEPFNTTQTTGSSDSITDEMDHDRNIDGSLAPQAEDSMHEDSGEPGQLQNGITTVGITIDISHNAQDKNSGDLAFLDRNLGSVSSRLNAIFRSLRSGRHGHRLNMWVDEVQTHTGSGAPAIPQGIEELLVSRLSRPASEQSSDQNATEQQTQDKVEVNQTQESDAIAIEEAPAEENTSNMGAVNTSPSSAEVGVTNTVDVGPIDNDILQRGDASNAQERATDIQYERGSDATLRDVEAVSQESSGSGATLGESLRSLEVEIGSADGHDDGGERQGPTDRISLGDLQPNRPRRSSGNSGVVGGRETSLQSVSEVSPDPSEAPGQTGSADEQNINQAVGSVTIDPAFLDALPEELRAEVLSTQQRQATQPPIAQTQSEGDIDPEFLAALPPDIRTEVLAQQRAAQRGNQSHELEGQPVEMDTVSIIATFPSELREEVLLTSSDAILANLTPALVAEANMLRERSVGGKLVEVDGAPLVDMEDLKALVRLLRVVQSTSPKSLTADHGRGKAVMTMEEDQPERLQNQKSDMSIVLLLSLLNQSLYLRSVAHLEQLLNLLEVIIDSTNDNSGLSNKSGVSPPEPQAGSESVMAELQVNASGAAGTSSASDDKSLMTVEQTKSSASVVNDESNSRDVLLGLPQAELRLLCSLLAREGLSDNAYGLVAVVMKKLVAIAPTHCRLFIMGLANSVQQLIMSAMKELHGYEEAEEALLNTSSSDGTAILRVLQALSSLISTIHEKEKDSQLLPEKELNDVLSLVWDIDAALEPLWLELSTCISKIESFSESSDRSGVSGSETSTNSSAMPPLPAGSQNILPYIESFFVTCEKLCPGQSGSVHDFSTTVSSDFEEASTSTVAQKSPGSHPKVDEKHLAFVKFSERHKKLLNAFIRQNSGLLEKSLSLMLKVPRIIDFDNKRNYFRSKIKDQHDHHHSPLRISVRRAYVLEDSYNRLRMHSTQDLKGRLTVNFQGEEGIDAGGLTREWYQLLSRVGKALFDGQLLDVHFTRSFYKHILGVKVTYHDIEAIDPDYFKNLKWMLENDVSDIPDLTFSIDADEEKLILYERTEVTDHELIPGGRNIRVTEENKREYVDLIAEHRLTTAIRPQINAFMEGFNELMPRELVSIFNDRELELLISGLPDIDLDNLRENTEYSGYSPASPVIQWFWEIVQGFSEEDKARLLQFVTGTSKVPLEGFSALQGISGSQKFQIHKAYGSPDHLPSAHTCFNQLDLPEYPSKEQLEERLLLAIHEANEGFGFG
ncbi:E3 ubiquitin-protein ligase UPL2 [Acorus gramineus]|uniref:HECT-type E3 ubiquitin transferase n=1 Tax=Acorus gramineus TaxID=55184 RepID=A0AAV9BGP4_ACOGR|nr:E3 ubiquitin-protein ligase UPL2 [Acorus gramineus]